MNEKVTQQASESRQDRARKMMLWFGIASLIITFAGWTSAYIVSSTREDWMSDFQLPPAFWFSTVVIVLSSFTYWLAFGSVKRGQAWAGHVPEAGEAVRQGRKVLARYHGAGDDAIWLHVATAWVADPAEANESLAQVEDYAAGSGLPYRRVLAALSGLALHARLGHASEVDRAFAVAEREVHGLPEPGLLELLLEGFRTAAQLLDEPSEALNPQEVVMLKLLAGGATRSQIAHETSYSVNTVKAYLRSAYRKLGVADREQAVAAAVALDIVDAASVAHREAEHG